MSSSEKGPATHIPFWAGEEKWRWLLCTMVAAYYFILVLYPMLFRLLGLNFEYMWFLDSHALLAASDAASAGLNPYEPNPLDRLGRPHVYSHVWLYLSHLGLTREDNFWLGGFFALSFFTTAFCWLRPRSAGEAAWYFLILASPAVVLAVERGNNDLLIFSLLAAVVPLITHRREWVRWCALAPILAATLLKFYPAVAVLVLAAGESRREAVSRGVISVVLIALVFLYLRPELAVLEPIMPKAEGLLSFGAPQAFAGLGVSEGRAGLFGLGLGVVIGLIGLLAFPGMKRFDEQRRRAEWMAFVLGASVLAGCFFARPSYLYRLIYVVLTLPFLWRLRGDVSVAPRVRRLGMITAGLMLAALWGDGMVLSVLMGLTHLYSVDSLVAAGAVIAGWRQPLMWVFFSCLIFWGGIYLRQLRRTYSA